MRDLSQAMEQDPRDPDALYTKLCPEYISIQRNDLFWYERLWAVLLRQLEKRTKGRWLLEFGSGPGFLCAQAKRRGWDVLGIEPSETARIHAIEELGVAVCASVGAVGADAAIATEVLEHVEDPAETLLSWNRSLAPRGLLAISVPNDNNPLQRLFWGTKKPWITPLHVQYFTPRTIKEEIEMAGFEVVWQRTSFPVELLLVIPFLPRKSAWKLSRLWPAPPLLWRFGIGRHCMLIARKR